MHQFDRIPKQQWLQQYDCENCAPQLPAARTNTSYNGKKEHLTRRDVEIEVEQTQVRAMQDDSATVSTWSLLLGI